MSYSLVSAQCVYILVVLPTNIAKAWHCVKVRVNNVSLAMFLLAKALATETTVELVIVGILKAIIINTLA